MKLRDYSLSVFLIALFLASWLAQSIFSSAVHGWSFLDTWTRPEFWRATLENWQSEFLQLATMVIATAVFIHRGSTESRDSNDRLEEKIDKLLESKK